MKITTILPVSRIKYLDRVLESILNQTHEIKTLLVIYDGPKEHFVDVRNKIAALPIPVRLCVQSRSDRMAFNIHDRRMRIVELHKHFQELIDDAEAVFSIEDDGILPPHALEDLLKVYNLTPDAGLVSGVELGRWGIPYVGAWKVDNPKQPTNIESMTANPEVLYEPIDASGLYCALIRAGKYKEHDFTTRNGLGPDVNLGLYLRKEGYNNMIHWGVPVTHLQEKGGQTIEIDPNGERKVVKLKLLSANIWQSYR